MKNEEKLRLNISGVPETMLWTVHNRANEAIKKDGLLKDDLCVKIYQSIEYDYEKSFGKANSSHGFRSKVFDDYLKEWLSNNPDGSVVEVGAGLETQFHRINPQYHKWYIIDLPEAIDIREKLIPKAKNLKNIRKSALDFSWFKDIEEPVEGPLFISFQGLLMYFDEDEAQSIVKNSTIMFDTIPKWLSKRSLKGWNITKDYKTPVMPWGIDRNKISKKLKSWIGNDYNIEIIDYQLSGFWGVVYFLLKKMPILKNKMPQIVFVSKIKTVNKKDLR